MYPFLLRVPKTIPHVPALAWKTCLCILLSFQFLPTPPFFFLFVARVHFRSSFHVTLYPGGQRNKNRLRWVTLPLIVWKENDRKIFFFLPYTRYACVCVCVYSQLEHTLVILCVGVKMGWAEYTFFFYVNYFELHVSIHACCLCTPNGFVWCPVEGKR